MIIDPNCKNFSTLGKKVLGLGCLILGYCYKLGWTRPSY